MDKALDILLKETSRIQDLALTMHAKGEHSVIGPTKVSKRRFRIDEETLKELNQGNIQLLEKGKANRTGKHLKQ